MYTEGEWIESKSVCLTKAKQNYTHNSSPINSEYDPHGLMAEIDNVYKTIRKFLLFFCDIKS